MSWPKYIEQLDYIKAVTEMLNAGPGAPESVGYHIHVELRENDTFRKVGEWSDEIAPDCWSYEDKEAK